MNIGLVLWLPIDSNPQRREQKWITQYGRCHFLHVLRLSSLEGMS
uniref:Uncharacterized protein n=1 Tax=Rhizophora mucronata TaxID=61149 RepID=A0A2P2IK94_RHIMU